jgi:hypothetical protein
MAEDISTASFVVVRPLWCLSHSDSLVMMVVFDRARHEHLGQQCELGCCCDQKLVKAVMLPAVEPSTQLQERWG